MNSNKQTILYLITQSEYGGAQRYIFDLAANLKNEFNIIVAFSEQNNAGGLAEKLHEIGVATHIIPHLKRAISPFNDFLAIKEIIKLIKETKPDIIHLNSSKISILGSLSVLVYRAQLKTNSLQLFYTVHGWVFNEQLSRLKKLFYKYAEKYTACVKDKIICVSEFDRQTGINIGINPNKLLTIHNGIAKIDFFSSAEAKKLLNAKFPFLNLATDDFAIATIGHLYANKNYAGLLAAAKILRAENRKFKILIIGEGTERDKLSKIIIDYQLYDMVFLLGEIPNAGQYLQGFNAYLNCSLKEGLSYTLLEAMQAGLPTIATSVGGSPEIITDKKNGFLIPPNSCLTLAKKIKQLLDSNDCLKFQKTAQNTYLEKFQLQEMINQTKRIYSSRHSGESPSDR